jgi:aquaglyceroporin related protein, other eukaryote
MCLQITVQYTLGFSYNLSQLTSHNVAYSPDTGVWAWGLATMLAIYIAGGISGAHLNPAISLMLYIYRGFPLKKVPSYVCAQLFGAILATFLTFGIFRFGLDALDATNSQHQRHLVIGQHNLAPQIPILPPPPAVKPVFTAYLTYPHYTHLTTTQAFFTETLATSILTISVLALGDDTNAPPGAGMNAFIVGLLITSLGMSFGSLTGLAMNPVRDFGPRLALFLLQQASFSDLFSLTNPSHSDNVVSHGVSVGAASVSVDSSAIGGGGYWLTTSILAPLLGAILGGLVYDGAIFVGGESPVNYPVKRVKRAARKWRRGWGIRFGWVGRRRDGRRKGSGKL